MTKPQQIPARLRKEYSTIVQIRRCIRFPISCLNITIMLYSCQAMISLPSRPTSLPSRPAPAVISTYPRCHLDRRERSQTRLGLGSSKTKTRFLASLRNDSGGIIRSFTLSGTSRFLAGARNDSGEPVIATYPRCHLDLPPLSSRPQGEISNRAWNGLRQRNNKRFLAPLRNDSGGSIAPFALAGTTRFLAIARNDKDKRK